MQRVKKKKSETNKKNSKCMALNWGISTDFAIWGKVSVCLYVCLDGLNKWPHRVRHSHFFFFISPIHRLFFYRHVWLRNKYDKTGNQKIKRRTFTITQKRGNFFFNTSQETIGSDLHHITSWFFFFCLFVTFAGNNCAVLAFHSLLYTLVLVFHLKTPFW